MLHQLLLSCLLLLLPASSLALFPVLNTVPELTAFWGYGCENHSITTEDNFTLTFHRMVGLEDGLPGAGEVVYLQHGLFGSSARWTSGPPDKVRKWIRDKVQDSFLGGH